MERLYEQISVKVANTQMRHLRVEVEKGSTRTVKGSGLAGPKENARSEALGELSTDGFSRLSEG